MEHTQIVTAAQLENYADTSSLSDLENAIFCQAD